MLTELEIEGFKSFGSPGVHVSLSPLNFVVGPNASGKTNFIEALRFLQNALRQDVEFAVNDLGGPADVRNKIQRQRQEEKHLRLRVHLDDTVRLMTGPEGQWKASVTDFHYALAIDLRTADEHPVIVDEQLTAKTETASGEAQCSVRRGSEEVTISSPPELGGMQDTRKLPVLPGEKSRPVVSAGAFNFALVAFRHLVLQWRFFSINPQVARQPSKELPHAGLGRYGENLALVLHHLEQNAKENGLQGLVASLRSAVPGLKGIQTKKDGIEGKWALQVLEERIRGAINPNAVSDGTIRLIALLLIATLGTEERSLIAIEEPENSVHPHLSEHLVDVFRETSSTSQIIATTHNPAFLDYLNPHEVLFCGKVDGLTRIRRADDLAEVESFKKHFSLGDLWVQGTFDRLFEGQE